MGYRRFLSLHHRLCSSLKTVGRIFYMKFDRKISIKLTCKNKIIKVNNKSIPKVSKPLVVVSGTTVVQTASSVGNEGPIGNEI